MLHAAAETVCVAPEIGTEGQSLTHAKVGEVFSPLKTTLTLVKSDRTAVCLIATHFMIEQYCLSNLLRRRVARELDLLPEQVFVFSSHNHTDALLTTEPPQYGVPRPDTELPEAKLTTEGHALLNGLLEAARRARNRVVPVHVAWNVGHERRITYNRKGRRADGSTYLMREEDRLLLGKDFNGDIDDHAPVVAFLGPDGKPVCFLVQFAGHPTTVYHPEHPVVFGDYPQVACDDLSAAFGGVPVGFLQGCAGDLNSKGLLGSKPVKEKLADAIQYGHWLGDTYIQTARHLQPAVADDLAFAWQRVRMPFQNVPTQPFLQQQLAEMDDFIRRCNAGDETAINCVGLNVARTMSPRYRAALIEPCRRWAQWALDFHLQHRLDSAPTYADVDIAAIRIGDVGIIGMPCEPFLGIGRQIKRDAKLPLAVPCGYMNDQSVAYIPDKGNNGHMDYVSSFYRYTTSMLPYQDPAGDLLAQAACQMLRDMPRGQTKESSK
jgi:hypothetical protein